VAMETELLFPPGCLCQKTADGVVFGNVSNFSRSWVQVTPRFHGPVTVSARMRMVQTPERGSAWMGVKVGALHYFANSGHLFYVTADGIAVTAQPTDDMGHYQDIQLGAPDERTRLDPRTWKVLEIEAGTNDFKGKPAYKVTVKDPDIGSYGFVTPTEQMPHVWTAGAVMLQAFRCLVEVGEVRISDNPVELPNPVLLGAIPPLIES
jgi:hypothetical protein